MLILSRRTGEAIVVNQGEITIAVLGTTRTKVRLGVSAPESIPVRRMEVHQRLRQAGSEQVRDGTE